MRCLLALLVAIVTVVGCRSPARDTIVRSQPEAPASFSLFSGAGNTLSDSTIAQLLDTPVQIPDSARIAVLQVSTRGSVPSYSYYRLTERELDAQEAYLDTLRAQLLPGGVGEVEFLPSLLVPEEPSIPVLREIAVRLQADALLVFRVSSDLFQDARFFDNDEFKAYATCEAVLMDVRTGALPFSTVVTRSYLTKKRKDDLSNADARRRAEQEAVLLALVGMGDQVATFLQRP